MSNNRQHILEFPPISILLTSRNLKSNAKGQWIVLGFHAHVISDFRREVDEIYALLGYYAAYSNNSLMTFRDNLSVSVKMVPTGSPET